MGQPRDLRHIEVPASDALERIAKGLDVSYDSVVIAGDLNLSHLNLQLDDYGRRIVASRIRTTGSRVDGEVQLSRARFMNQTDLSGSTFQGDVNLSRSQFGSRADFMGWLDPSGAAFFRGARFDDAEFDTFSDLSSANFGEDASFKNVVFAGYANFNESRFNDYAYFKEIDFQGPASLNRSRITDCMIDWRSVDCRLIYSEDAYQSILQMFWTQGT